MIVHNNCHILAIEFDCGNHGNQQEAGDVDTDVEMRRCAAYEVTALSKKKVVMESNPAYEVVTPNV